MLKSIESAIESSGEYYFKNSRLKSIFRSSLIIGSALGMLAYFNISSIFSNNAEAQISKAKQIHQENLDKIARINQAQLAKAEIVNYIFVDSAAASGGNGSAQFP